MKSPKSFFRISIAYSSFRSSPALLLEIGINPKKQTLTWLRTELCLKTISISKIDLKSESVTHEISLSRLVHIKTNFLKNEELG